MQAGAYGDALGVVPGQMQQRSLGLGAVVVRV